MAKKILKNKIGKFTHQTLSFLRKLKELSLVKEEEN